MHLLVYIQVTASPHHAWRVTDNARESPRLQVLRHHRGYKGTKPYTQALKLQGLDLRKVNTKCYSMPWM